MINNLEKSWPFIAFVLFIAILISLFLWPTITPFLVLILIIVGTGMAITFAVRRRVQAYRQGRIDRLALLRGISLDIVGILITIIAAVLLGGKAGEYIGQKTGKVVEATRPGLGFIAGILAGLITGLGVGLGVGLIMRWILLYASKVLVTEREIDK